MSRSKSEEYIHSLITKKFRNEVSLVRNYSVNTAYFFPVPLRFTTFLLKSAIVVAATTFRVGRAEQPGKALVRWLAVRNMGPFPTHVISPWRR